MGSPEITIEFLAFLKLFTYNSLRKIIKHKWEIYLALHIQNNSAVLSHLAKGRIKAFSLGVVQRAFFCQEDLLNVSVQWTGDENFDIYFSKFYHYNLYSVLCALRSSKYAITVNLRVTDLISYR